MKMVMKKKEGAFKEEPNPTIVDDRAVHEAISKRAFELYEKRGGRHGHDLEDWLEAERLILSQKKADTTVHKSFSSMPRPTAGR
jgi:hypothetical protein